ncbi:MAG: DUF924 domain-containing protein [Myxococcales bacterium FL481]|nr:MAG: DUF924 domain-containing protein [Myxococcales bacterium FL481]
MSNDDSVSSADVIRFWFGAPGPVERVEPAVSRRWWGKDPAFDEEVRRRFAEAHDRATRGALHDWATTPRGRLALVIVLDQFSRNMFRDDPRAFASDALAQAHTSAAIAAGDDLDLTAIERVFVYMPLMHAENLALQEQCVQCFERLAAAAPAEHADMLRNNLDFAVRHRDIVAKFGRFPHRNATLGRNSSAAELAFLQEPNSSF